MVNYAEELTYWYLRLNGFFLIENFVIHREGHQIEHRADADLLAIRFPHVREAIGGMPMDFDNDILFRAFNQNRIIGLIVEVKSSRGQIQPNIFTDRGRMQYALHRFGFEMRDEEIEALANNHQWIRNEQITGERPFQIGKLLVHDQNNEINPNFAFNLNLTHVTEFIKGRFIRYRREKWGSRMFFPSPLMQYLIWETSAP
jgi:hypothetical protein